MSSDFPMIGDNTLVSQKMKRIFLAVSSFLLFYIVSYLIDPYAHFWHNYFDRNLLSMFVEWITTFVICCFISESSIFIHNRLNHWIPWMIHPSRRLIIEATMNVCAVMFIISFNLMIDYFIYMESSIELSELSIEDKRGVIQWVIVSILISFMCLFVNTSYFLVTNWKNTELEVTIHRLRVSRLKQASVEAELNALKLQLDSHFIFNNLSVLSELILKNQQLGYEFSENFAKVYRFLLVNSKKNLISLNDELQFLQSYIFLIEQRIGKGVQFEIDVDKNSLSFLLPPLTLQLLLENALKHNKTNKNNPLIIRIYSTDTDTVVIENKLLPIELKLNYSVGIGLKNILSRFNLLAERQPEIIRNEESFKVIVYLITYDQ